MISSHSRFAFAALATASFFGCGAAEKMQPQTPSTTTTSAGVAAAPEPLPEGAPGAGAAGTPAPIAPQASDVPQGAPTSEMGTGNDGAPASTPVAAASVASASAPNDAQVAAALKASSRAVLEQAREAVRKGHTPQVRQLAAQILDVYGRAAARFKAVQARSDFALEESPLSDDATRRGEAIMLRLRAPQGGTTFDRSYVDGQVDELEKTLELIDLAATQVRSGALRGYLGEVRSEIAESQRAAADVQVALSK